MDPDLTCDVIVVGAGCAAMAAAMAAHDQGARVVVLEKAPRAERGGNTTLTGHFRFAAATVDDVLSAMAPGPSEATLKTLHEHFVPRLDSDLWDEAMRVTGGHSDPDLLGVHVAESLATVQWLHSKGHNWVLSNDPTTDSLVMMEGGGPGFQRRNFAYLERHSIPVLYETAAAELILDALGWVEGVIASTPQGRRPIHARSVVLASGGFEANPSARASYLGPGWDTVKMRGVPYNTGDGLWMALNAGAMPYGSWSSCHASPQDVDRPPAGMPSWNSIGGVEWNRYAYPFGIMVNRDGERFVDEADAVRSLTYAKMGRSILAQPGGRAFQIFDARARRLGLIGKNYERATAHRSGTVEGLAAGLGIEPDRLLATVRAFNAAGREGEARPDAYSPDGLRTVGLLPPKGNFAMPLEEGPFEAYEVCCGITFTFGGLAIDPVTAQVRDTSGRPMPGLFTAGEMVGGLWHGNYPGGSGLSAGATFGRRAGQNAARQALTAVA